MRAAFLGILGLLAAADTACADAIADFYRGRQVSWILSADAGGGYSSYARAFAPYFGAHIPGKPTIVIQNMPGGGGLRAMNYLYSLAARDGATIGLVHSGVPFAPLYGIKGAQFDPRAMHWIGSIATARGICVAWHTAKMETWQDLLEREFVVGGSGVGSQMETIPAMLNKLFGTRMKVISGYRGSNEIYLAMERGEVQGRCGGLVSSINSTRPDWFAQRKVTVPTRWPRGAILSSRKCPRSWSLPRTSAHGGFSILRWRPMTWTAPSSRPPGLRPSALPRCVRPFMPP